MKVSIIGATGYSGLELIRLLRDHPEVTLESLHSYSMNESSFSHAYPHLQRLVDLPLEAVDPQAIMNRSEAVFFATPSGVVKELAVPFVKENFPVIDLSGDFRLKKEGQYEQWYHQPSAPPAFLQKAAYGLADFSDKYTTNLIANPGCYATATLLALAPLVKERLVHEEFIVVDGKSGLSGAGKQPSATTQYASVNDNMSLYKMNKHQHIPEIMQQLQQWDPAIPAIQFSTSLIPVTRGIFLTAYAKAKKALTEKQLHQIYQAFYQEKVFIRVQPLGVYPELKQVVGSNFCDIGVAYNPVTAMITVVAVIDNLVKGAAGQAIQNLNILKGMPVEMGLTQAPIYP